MLHEKDMGQIGYKKVCKAEEKEVPYDQIVKGYEYEKGEFVVLKEEDFEKANARKTKTIDVVAFAKEQEVDPKYFDTPYYLEPEKKAEHAYVLLREALKKAKKAGVAKFVIRNKERLGMIKPEGNVLMLVQLRYPDELRSSGALTIPGKETIAEQEMKLAMLLIDQLTKPFDPGEYRDTYTEELEQLIEAKIKGKKPRKKGAEPVPTAVPDLMSVLMQSLQEEKGKEVGV